MSALDAYLKRPAKGGATRTTTGQQLGSSGVNPATLANVEELKTETDIPFFNDPQSELQYASAWTPDAPSDRTDVGCTPERDPDLELDDSYTDSDYGVGGSGSGSCSAANSYYQSPTPSNSDIMLRPPSNSSLQHSQPSPGSSVNGAGYTYSQALQPPPPPSQRTAAGAAQAVASTPSSSSPFYHPNMWYPNAPYGNGSGSGNAYNRYAGYAVPLASGSVATAAATAAAFAHGMLPHHVHHHSQQHHSHPHAGMHPHPHPLPPHHQLQHPHETMMEMFQLSNSGREARNRAEKNRRDKLNGSIQELSTMVPHVAESPRRVDKTAVLRFAAHGLRLKYVFGKTLHDHKPQVTDTLMGMLDSFFLTLTCHGQILLISSSIEHHLGHCQTDLYGQSILQIAHPDDHEMLKQQLIPNDLENLFEAHTEQTDDDGEPRQRSKSEEDYIDRKLRDDRRSFRVRLARAGPRSEPTAYEVVKIDGCFRRSDEAPRSVRSNTLSSSLQLIRRSRGRDDAIPLHTISGNDIVLTACARIIRPPKIANRLFDANTLEYRTRHLIDGRIIDCDQRIGIVAGYMTDEVRNLNPFTFMHNDDVRWVIVALRQMYDCNSSYGESTYRLFTRNGNIIYLQSKGYLEIDKETNRVHSFVCVNTLLDDEEGKRRVQEMKKKFSVIINTQIPQSTLDVPASEHPAQLEKAVLRLIHNLKSNDNDDHDDDDDDDVGDCDDDDDGDEDGDIEDGIASIASSFNFDSHPNPHQSHSHSHSHHSRSHRNHSYLLDGSMSMARMSNSKTPPLALVPPETSSVKSSISKSVSVVNVTAAKHLRGLHSATSAISAQASSAPASFTSSTTSAIAAAASERSTSTLIFDPSCSCLGDGDCDYCLTTLTTDATATLKRSSRGQDAPDNDNLKLPKRRFMPSTDIEHVINNSLQQIQRDLHQQMNVAAQLRDQSNRYELPDTSQRIDEIMEEHLKQSKQYVNIKNDFEEQLQTKANTTKTVRESDTQSSNSSNTRGTGGGGDATN